MADAFRQAQKLLCLDGRPNGGKFPYGCPCCREYADKNRFKKYSRRQARRILKRMPDEFLLGRR